MGRGSFISFPWDVARARGLVDFDPAWVTKSAGTPAKRVLTNMRINEVSLVDRPANERPFIVAKRADGTVAIRSESTFRILKDTDGKHELLGVILQPTTRTGPDAQGDIYDEETVAGACDNFAGGMGFQHTASIVDGAKITRNWIALSDDFSVPDQPIYRGSWLQRWEITDPGLWEKISSGAITGFSIGGVSTVSPA